MRANNDPSKNMAHLVTALLDRQAKCGDSLPASRRPNVYTVKGWQLVGFEKRGQLAGNVCRSCRRSCGKGM
jgi:hypothetical protein